MHASSHQLLRCKPIWEWLRAVIKWTVVFVRQLKDIFLLLTLSTKVEVTENLTLIL